jgi:hypothetical protein
VIYGRRSELLAEAKRRIAENPQAYNPKVYGEHDGGGTQVLYLAAADVSFKDLGFLDLPNYSSARLSESVSHAPYLHGVTPFALYAAAAFIIRRNHAKQHAGEAAKNAKAAALHGAQDGAPNSQTDSHGKGT